MLIPVSNRELHGVPTVTVQDRKDEACVGREKCTGNAIRGSRMTELELSSFLCPLSYSVACSEPCWFFVGPALSLAQAALYFAQGRSHMPQTSLVLHT